jgi:4-cresol dehydrogenase (hydroxylating) flavoprotein subunit
MLDAAIRELRETVGTDHVFTDAHGMDRYTWSTIPLTREIAAVVQPAGIEEVQRIVQVARNYRLALYPISTGENWGYGSALPARDHGVIVDLRRMNRIHEVNRDLAYAVVEPGVTQRQLYDHLQAARIPLALSPTGAGPGRSILGNTLERGFSIGPYGDHFLAQCGMEVVLATGEILRTGLGHYPDAKAAYLFKWGVGPYLDGLFTQSNFGIVTKIGVWLMPTPESFEACYFGCNSEEQLGRLIDAMREMMFVGVFRGPINLLHRNRVLIMLDRYPWQAMGGQTPLSESLAQWLAAERKIGLWNGVGAICGTREQVKAAKQTIKRILKGKVDRLNFLSDSRLELLRRFPTLLGSLMNLNVPELLKTLQGSYGLLKGVPTEIALSLAYWRNRRPRSAAADVNPARDNCGLMWFSPVIPITKDDVFAFRRIVESILAKHTFEACLTFTALNERCFDCTLPLLYDKDDPSEVAKAQACYQELVDRCREQGYVAYRLGLQSMQAETARDDVFWTVTTKLKAALDPDGILAPGRYAR